MTKLERIKEETQRCYLKMLSLVMERCDFLYIECNAVIDEEDGFFDTDSVKLNDGASWGGGNDGHDTNLEVQFLLNSIDPRLMGGTVNGLYRFGGNGGNPAWINIDILEDNETRYRHYGCGILLSGPSDLKDIW